MTKHELFDIDCTWTDPRPDIEKLLGPIGDDGELYVIGISRGQWVRFRAGDPNFIAVMCDKWEAQRITEASREHDFEYKNLGPNGAQYISAWRRKGARP